MLLSSLSLPASFFKVLLLPLLQKFNCFHLFRFQLPLPHLWFKLDDHPYYSSDLAPSDSCLFPNMKKILSGKRYQSNDEVTSIVEDYFEGQKET